MRQRRGERTSGDLASLMHFLHRLVHQFARVALGVHECVQLIGTVGVTIKIRLL
jgi:hypothetical protein